MRQDFALRTRIFARPFEAADASESTAPTEVDGQEVVVHKRANLFPTMLVRRGGR